MGKASISPIWVFVFLLPTFVQRLFIGGEAGSYDQLSGFSLAALGYICHLAVVLRFWIRPVSTDHALYVLNRWILIAVLSVIHALILSYEQAPGTGLAIVSIGRHLLWIFACLAMTGLTTTDDLIRRLVQFTHATFIIVILTYAIYSLTGYPLQILLSDGQPRAQGLLSEPSGLGSLIAGYVGLAAWQGRWWRILLGTAVMFMTFSVFAFVGLVAGFVFGFVLRHFCSGSVSTMLVKVVLFLPPMALVGVYIFAQPISELARATMHLAESSGLDANWLYHGFGARLLQAAGSLDEVIKIISSGLNDIQGGIFRFSAIFILFEQMQQSYRLWVGYGIGAHAQVTIASFETILDFGLLPMLISSFGLIGGLSIFIWVVRKLSSGDKAIICYVVPFALLILFNSAGGIHIYSIVIVAALLLDRAGQFIPRRSLHLVQLQRPPSLPLMN
jgi:hypothetical protein